MDFFLSIFDTKGQDLNEEHIHHRVDAIGKFIPISNDDSDMLLIMFITKL